MKCKDKKTWAEVALLRTPEKLTETAAESNRVCTGQNDKSFPAFTRHRIGKQGIVVPDARHPVQNATVTDIKI